MVCDKFGLACRKADLTEWEAVVNKERNLTGEVTIGLVGKYVELRDAYLSVAEALRHAGIHEGVKIDIKWIHSVDVTEETADEIFKDVDGIIVPGGFGNRGIEGKILAAKYARENKIPYLGLCLGLQIAVIEFARNVLGRTDANSTELDPETTNPVIDIMPDQKNISDKGGTMRLGLYPCMLKDGSLAKEAYCSDEVSERHRHRYEVNNEYRDLLTDAGMIISGTSPDGHLVEMVELKDHPWYVATQAHPEFKSRPNRPHPLFSQFIAHAKN